MLTIALLLASLTLLGCTDPMESVSQITKFRVMGIRAEPPEIRAGQGTTLEVLFADPKGEGREVEFFWLNCLGSLSMDADLESGCMPVSMPQLETFTNDGHIYSIPVTPPEILPRQGGVMPVTVVAVLCAGGEIVLDEEDLPEGEISSFDTMCQGGDGLVAMKSFDITSANTLNQNPVIEEAYFNRPTSHMPLTAEQDTEDDPQMGYYECVDAQGCREGAPFEVYLTKDSFEPHTRWSLGDWITTVEDPYISWFVAGVNPIGPTGQFIADRSRIVVPDSPEELPAWTPDPFDVHWVPPRDGGIFRVWAVARDMRGGMTWKSYLIQAVVPID